MILKAKHRYHPKRTALVSLALATGLTGTAAGVASLVGFGAANATATVFTTTITNRPDSGNGGTWAYDNFTRTLSITKNADQSTCPGAPSGYDPTADICYTATVNDTGTSSVIVGALAPNQSTAGVKIADFVKPTMNGTGGYALYAPNTDTLNGTVPTTENDNFSTSGSSFVSSGNWPKQAFTTPSVVQVNENTFSYTYTTTCEKWVDADNNGDGNLAGDGNITGQTFCVVGTSNKVVVKNRQSGRCLNEDPNSNLLSQYACNVAGIYKSLQWQVITYSDGTKYLQSVATGRYVKDGALGVQLSQSSTLNPMVFQNGGIFRFPNNSLVMDNKGFGTSNFNPTIGWTYNGQNNQRWDFANA